MPFLDSYFNVLEAAAFLGVHPETVKRLCQRGPDRLPNAGPRQEHEPLAHIGALHGLIPPPDACAKQEAPHDNAEIGAIDRGAIWPRAALPARGAPRAVVRPFCCGSWRHCSLRPFLRPPQKRCPNGIMAEHGC